MVKIRIDIVENANCIGPHGGKRYNVNKWVFGFFTHRTLEHACVKSNCTLAEARAVKRQIKEAYAA